MVIETFRKKPVTVETMLWDGTLETAEQIKQWVGRRDNGDCRFLLPQDTTFGLWREAHIWNDQEHGWIPCPVSHRVVKGPLGEFYPISPEAVDQTYERADRLPPRDTTTEWAWKCEPHCEGHPASTEEHARLEVSRLGVTDPERLLLRRRVGPWFVAGASRDRHRRAVRAG